MSSQLWKARLNASQAEYLPLISSCLLGVLILTVVRDPIVLNVPLPNWTVLLNTILILIMLVIFLLVQFRVVPNQLSEGIIMVALLCLAAKAISATVLQAEPLPLYVAILLLADSLCFLSIRYLLLTSAATVLAWAVVAMQVLETVQVLTTVVVMLVTIVFSFFIIRRRIEVVIEVYQLEQKFETLKSILPMCSNCKKTRDTEGNWKSIEEYVQEQQAGLQVSHGVCPVCTEELYGDILRSDKPNV